MRCSLQGRIDAVNVDYTVIKGVVVIQLLSFITCVIFGMMFLNHLLFMLEHFVFVFRVLCLFETLNVMYWYWTTPLEVI